MYTFYNWMAMSMLAAYYYRQKDYANMKAVMEKASKVFSFCF